MTQQMRQGTSGFYSCVPNFTPTCFGKWLPSSGGRRGLICYSSNVCIVGVYGLRSVQCDQLSVHTHNTDNAWVAYKAPTPPWRWQPLAETCRGKIWNTLIKSTSSLTHLLVILQRYYKMLSPTVKRNRGRLLLHIQKFAVLSLIILISLNRG
jgi:hypothetical protein